MSSSLTPSGPYAVGATTFVLPVRPVRNIGRARVRRESGVGTEPALQLEDVVFTAFYPTEPTTFADKHEKGLFWMIRCVRSSFTQRTQAMRPEIGLLGVRYRGIA